MSRSKKPATHVCATCEKSTITPVQIALLKMNDTHFDYKCTVKDSHFHSQVARFNRKNCGDYKGPGSGDT